MVPIHLRTLFSSSATSLLQEITTLSSKYGNKGHTILFSLSTNFRKSEDLEAVFGQLVAFNDPSPKTSTTNLPQQYGNTLGCLMEPPSGISPSQALESCGRKMNYISCSVGVFDSANVIAFRSNLPSEEQPQVGRWHSFRKMTTAGSDVRLDQRNSLSPNAPVDWDDVWAQSSLQSDFSPILPHELQETSSSKISDLIYFTASHPTQLTTALSSHLPHTTCLGLIAAPTHFITGRAVTLVMNGKIFDSGAVGLAFKAPTDSQNHLKCETTFSGFHRLSEPIVVVQTEGNMLNAVKPLASESSQILNPTSLLLSAIQEAKLTAPTFKESEDFALAVLSSPPTSATRETPIERTYTITAGDPRNRGGALSLAGHRAPKPGSVVQFVHRPRDAPIVLSSVTTSSSPQTDKKDEANITFVTVLEAMPVDTQLDVTTDELPLFALDSTFLATSSRGFLLSKPGKITPSDSYSDTTWTATLPGTITKLASFGS